MFISPLQMAVLLVVKAAVTQFLYVKKKKLNNITADEIKAFYVSFVHLPLLQLSLFNFKHCLLQESCLTHPLYS